MALAAHERVEVPGVRRERPLDERLRGERAAAITAFALQLIALLAVATGVAWFARSPGIAEAASESPGLVLLILVGLFSFLVLLLSPGLPAGGRFEKAARGFSTT